MIKSNMWRQEEHKNGRIRLDALIAECGLSSLVITAESSTAKNSPTSTESVATFATTNATLVIVKRFCHLMNIMGGKAASLGLLNEVGEIKSIRNGCERYLQGTVNAYGVVLPRNWKQTTSKGGAHIPNYVMNFLTDVHSV